MSEFELLVIPLSLILGLGVTRILGGFIHGVRERESTSPHWLPIAWGSFILLYIIVYFNVLYDLDQRAESWTWTWYGPVLFQTVLLFLSAGLVFPRRAVPGVPTMLTDFEKHGRLALLPLGVLLASAPVMNRLQGVPWSYVGNLLNVVLTLVLVVAFVTKRRGVRTSATLAFGVVSVIGWVSIWSQPGD